MLILKDLDIVNTVTGERDRRKEVTHTTKVGKTHTKNRCVVSGQTQTGKKKRKKLLIL